MPPESPALGAEHAQELRSAALFAAGALQFGLERFGSTGELQRLPERGEVAGEHRDELVGAALGACEALAHEGDRRAAAVERPEERTLPFGMELRERLPFALEPGAVCGEAVLSEDVAVALGRVQEPLPVCYAVATKVITCEW